MIVPTNFSRKTIFKTMHVCKNCDLKMKLKRAKRIEKKEHKKKKKEETPNQWVKILSHEGFKFLSFLVLQRRNAKGREH